MGAYTEIKGNLIAMAKESKFDIIGHGANCKKMMGAGIAYQIAREFPIAYQADKIDTRMPRQRLGDLTYTQYGDNLFVVNLYTQYEGGPNLDYSALELSLRKMTLIFNKNLKIGLPQIGCGIAGGDWEKVKEIIQRVLSDYDVTVVMYEPTYVVGIDPINED